VDAADWQAAGLYDPGSPVAADRLALLEYLAGEGCTLEEMVEAHATDRLFALAGDRRIRPFRPRFDAEEAAEVLGTDAQTVCRLWRAFGLPAPNEPVLGELDVEALRAVLAVCELLGEEAAIALARVLGSGAARFAEAEAAAMRAGLGGAVDRARAGERASAEAFARVMELIPRIGVVLDSVHRHHVDGARRHFEQVAPTPDAVRCGVGFADLCGFTSLSSALPMPALSRLLAGFEDAATETVQDAGGRVVKFIGDAVMYVAPTAPSLTTIACRLVGHEQSGRAGLEVRAGIAFGDVLAQDGDYFGPPVNLAARLAAVAAPGQVLAAPAVVPLLGPDARAEQRPARPLRGIAEPVAAYAVTTA
jgi:class 3 adenylate cyclase